MAGFLLTIEKWNEKKKVKGIFMKKLNIVKNLYVVKK